MVLLNPVAMLCQCDSQAFLVAPRVCQLHWDFKAGDKQRCLCLPLCSNSGFPQGSPNPFNKIEIILQAVLFVDYFSLGMVMTAGYVMIPWRTEALMRASL